MQAVILDFHVEQKVQFFFLSNNTITLISSLQHTMLQIQSKPMNELTFLFSAAL